MELCAIKLNVTISVFGILVLLRAQCSSTWPDSFMDLFNAEIVRYASRVTAYFMVDHASSMCTRRYSVASPCSVLYRSVFNNTIRKIHDFKSDKAKTDLYFRDDRTHSTAKDHQNRVATRRVPLRRQKRQGGRIRSQMVSLHADAHLTNISL